MWEGVLVHYNTQTHSIAERYACNAGLFPSNPVRELTPCERLATVKHARAGSPVSRTGRLRVDAMHIPSRINVTAGREVGYRAAAYGRAPMRPYGAPQNDLPKSIQKLLP